MRFADYFFDGLFCDWAVFDSIHDAQSQIYSTREQVQDMQRKLDDIKTALRAETKKQQAQLNAIVLA